MTEPLKTAKQHNAEQGVGESEFHPMKFVPKTDAAFANDLGEAKEMIARALTEPKSSLPVGVWFNNVDFYRYRDTLPIVVESEIPMRPKQYVVLSGCVSCQLSRVVGKARRWLILPL